MKTFKKARTRTAVLALGVTAMIALAGCTPGTNGADTTAAPVSSIVTAWPADVATLDPGNVSTDQDKELTMNVYQRLLEYKFAEESNGSSVWSGLDVDPMLAESVDTDGSSATFHLRADATFYPSGNPLTAEDVRYSFERALAENGESDLNNGGIFDASQIVVVDDKTVTFNFTDVSGKPVAVTPTLLATMRMPNYGIVDSVEVKKHVTAADPLAAEWLRSNTAGTGPYYIDSRTPGEELVLKAVPNSWSDAPAFTEVTVRVVNNGNIASLIRGGQVNEALFGLTQKDLNDLETAGFTVDHQSTPDFIHLQLPEDTGPFADEKVRQAVAYTIPYDDIIDSIYFGRAERSFSYVNQKAPGYTDAWSLYSTDLDKAKELMDEAGNPEISITMRYSNAEPAYEDMAILLQDSLKEIGITVTLQASTPADMFDLIIGRATAASDSEASAPEMVMFNLSIYLDDPKSPVSFYSHTGGSLNYPRLSSPTIDGLADANQFAEQSDGRSAAYVEIQKEAATDASFIPLVITGRTVVMAPGITGASYSPEIGVRFWKLEPKS